MHNISTRMLSNFWLSLPAVLLTVLGLSATAAALPRLATYREFFVSPTGSDQSGSASEGFPFKTLEKARDEVRKVIPDMTGDVVVTIRGGIYPVSRTIVFGPDDSGRGTHRVIYRAATGETPVFSGGVPVTGWTLHKGNIWQAPLNRDCKLRALYVNDQRAVMTSRKVRPEGPWGEYIVTAGQAPWAWQSGRAADGVIYNISDLPAITRNPFNVEIENKTTWNENFVGVREITIESNHYVFKFQQPYGAIAQQIGWNAGFAFRREHIIQNAYELLEHPGEFYFDQAAKTLYYIPRPGEDMTTVQVVAPVTETLLRIEGQPLKRPVRNLTFEGLTFAYADYNLLQVAGSHGKATVQTATVAIAFANTNWHYDVYRAYDVLPGALVANAVEGLQLLRNVIKHTGSEGVVMSNDIKDSKVVGNVIRDCGGSAITLGHPQHVYENDTPDLKSPMGAGIEHERFPAGTESAPRRVEIANNYLPDNAALFHGHTIITVFYAEGVRIEHNWIPSAPYSGMNLGWGWCDFDGSAVADNPQWGHAPRSAVFPGRPTTVCRNNRVRANRVENTMSILRDGGGIYTLGNQPGTIIERNYVRKSEQSIYTDEGSANIVSRYNVIESPYARAHFAEDFGRKHSIRVENYFITEPKWKVTAPDCTFTDYTVCTNGVWPTEAQIIIKESGLEPAFQSICR